MVPTLALRAEGMGLSLLWLVPEKGILILGSLESGDGLV